MSGPVSPGAAWAAHPVGGLAVGSAVRPVEPRAGLPPGQRLRGHRERGGLPGRVPRVGRSPWADQASADRRPQRDHLGGGERDHGRAVSWSRETVGAVVHPRHHDQVAGNARRAQAVGVLDVLGVEQIEVTDTDPGRWQCGQARPPGSRGVLRIRGGNWYGGLGRPRTRRAIPTLVRCRGRNIAGDRRSSATAAAAAALRRMSGAMRTAPATAARARAPVARRFATAIERVLPWAWCRAASVQPH